MCFGPYRQYNDLQMQGILVAMADVIVADIFIIVFIKRCVYINLS